MEMDADDRRLILLELSKMSHPLENQSPHLYNIANGKICPSDTGVNVAESVDIGEKWFQNSGHPSHQDSMQPSLAPSRPWNIFKKV